MKVEVGVTGRRRESIWGRGDKRMRSKVIIIHYIQVWKCQRSPLLYNSVCRSVNGCCSLEENVPFYQCSTVVPNPLEVQNLCHYRYLIDNRNVSTCAGGWEEQVECLTRASIVIPDEFWSGTNIQIITNISRCQCFNCVEVPVVLPPLLRLFT